MNFDLVMYFFKILAILSWVWLTDIQLDTLAERIEAVELQQALDKEERKWKMR